jgi:transposase, IS5 family
VETQSLDRQVETKITTIANPELKFEGKLAKDNRWVIMSELIPWQEFEEEYAKNFSEIGIGAPAKPFRIALGSLIIKERLGTSDRESVAGHPPSTVEKIHICNIL